MKLQAMPVGDMNVGDMNVREPRRMEPIIRSPVAPPARPRSNDSVASPEGATRAGKARLLKLGCGLGCGLN